MLICLLSLRSGLLSCKFLHAIIFFIGQIYFSLYNPTASTTSAPHSPDDEALRFELVSADSVDNLVFDLCQFDSVLYESCSDLITRLDRSHTSRCSYSNERVQRSQSPKENRQTGENDISFLELHDATTMRNQLLNIINHQSSPSSLFLHSIDAEK